ncbi:MAG: ACP S-malonyltransferase [Pseudomonadota bacterium]
MKKYAALFPGQGAQSVGMLADLASEFPVVGETFAEASDVLEYDLWHLIQNGPAEKLALTEYTQPAMFVSDTAVQRAFSSQCDQAPFAVAGHSLGEYAALTAAGVFEFADAVSLIKRRAELMSTAVPEGEGGMAAILGLDDDTVIALCAAENGERVVQAVNFNAPAQVVISGHHDAMKRVLAAAEEAGAKKCIELAVSIPNHSVLMSPAAQPLVDKIRSIEVRDPAVPVVQNNDVVLCDSAEAIITSLCDHVVNPVYWGQTISYLQAQGVEALLELGPGKVLTGLNKRIDRRFPSVAVEDPASLHKALELLSGD